MRTYEHAAETLNALMQARGFTAAELSRRTGVDAGILRAIAAGRRRTVSTRTVHALAQCFGLPMQTLIKRFSGAV